VLHTQLEPPSQSAVYKPIEKFCREFADGGDTPLTISLDASTVIEVMGPCYLHGWLLHLFTDGTVHAGYDAAATGSTTALPPHRLVARARQFSSFLLIIGKTAGPNEFAPHHAIISQNKDEVMIPLLLDVLPSASEFKDAISSLSPEQRSFAEAFRQMQLELSVFGVCVVQLKPQLEVLLRLPADALTKEIQLTQDLMLLSIRFRVTCCCMMVLLVSMVQMVQTQEVMMECRWE
jgi:hypothetical protein